MIPARLIVRLVPSKETTICAHLLSIERPFLSSFFSAKSRLVLFSIFDRPLWHLTFSDYKQKFSPKNSFNHPNPSKSSVDIKLQRCSYDDLILLVSDFLLFLKFRERLWNFYGSFRSGVVHKSRPHFLSIFTTPKSHIVPFRIPPSSPWGRS